jgi:hypothetical protein
MQTVVIDGQKAMELISAAVEKRGKDFIYPSIGQCRYLYYPEEHRDGYFSPEEPESGDKEYRMYGETEEPVPSCMVGLILFDLDKGFVDLLQDHNDQSITGVLDPEEGGSEVFITGTKRYVFDGDAIHLFSVAQTAQDVGNTWGEAEEAASVVAGNMFPS